MYYKAIQTLYTAFDGLGGPKSAWKYIIPIKPVQPVAAVIDTFVFASRWALVRRLRISADWTRWSTWSSLEVHPSWWKTFSGRQRGSRCWVTARESAMCTSMQKPALTKSSKLVSIRSLSDVCGSSCVHDCTLLTILIHLPNVKMCSIGRPLRPDVFVSLYFDQLLTD